MGTYALIVAAGSGLRLGSEMPKQYLSIAGRSILEITASKFLECPAIDGVMVVIAKEHQLLYDEAIKGLGLLPCAYGGASRQISVKNGLEALSKYNPSKVLVHDAARPMVEGSLIERVVEALDAFEAVDVKVSVPDTIKDESNLKHAIDRSNMYLTQTPQGFRFPQILALHKEFEGRDLTDDVRLAIEGGISLCAVEGARTNFKITTEEDLRMAEKLLENAPEVRVGTGFDVHEVAEGPGHMPICGVLLPSKKRVIAHSDGDVGLHALMDAILGALALGDIGVHFPPDDMTWKDADSKELLRHVKKLIHDRGAEVSNVDITIMCEEPKVKPYREQMVKCISEVLEIKENQVSVKATTTEKLGFIGRQEGVAAQAVCTLKLYRD